MEFRCIGMSSSHSHSQVSINTILGACVRKLPGFNKCGRFTIIPFSPGMQPAWPGEPEALPQPPPPANTTISLYYSQIPCHIRWWYTTPQRTIHLTQQSHKMIQMTL